jgi:aminoglycoside phosphotransferase (APT) family kinase protein
MAKSDARRLPLIEVDLAQIRAMLSPVLKGAALIDVELVDGGLVNTLYRVRLADEGSSLCLRIFAAGQLPWKTERNILTHVTSSLPVPEVLLADCGERGFSHPYLVYRWIEGITLDDCRKQMPHAAFLSLSEPLGRLLAGVASFSLAGLFNGRSEDAHAGSSPIEALLSGTEERLQRGLARARLGVALADALWRLLEANASRLVALDCSTCLVHGDLGGQNILVCPANEGNWRVSGLIDWEHSFSGSALWDVGKLFRFARRYSQDFRERFENSYRGAGGNLTEGWWRIARLLDSTRLVEILNEERELPVVFAECRELIEAVIVCNGQ